MSGHCSKVDANKVVSAYHEIASSKLGAVLKNGLKRKAGGDKSSDKEITKTDGLLDKYCPKDLKDAGLSRQNNLYCYLAYKDSVVDITDGKLKLPAKLSQSPKHVLLRLYIDPIRCYVSNLDLYDQILEAIKLSQDSLAIELTHEYWRQITRLDKYDHTQGFKRPEVMVTYNVPKEYIGQVIS
jgi:hypothetical protein